MIVKGINRLFCDKIIIGVKNTKAKKDRKKISSQDAPLGDVTDAADVVNRYGTYNIQPTADTANLFPQISHGLPAKKRGLPNRKKRVDS